MPVWTVAGVCAVVAAALACAAPAVVRRLPLPVGGGRDDTGTTAVVGAPTMVYSAIADTRWFLPGGVIVSGATAGTLGLAFGADRLLLVLVPLVPIGYVLAVVDARAQLLPRRLVVSATIAVAAALVVEWALTGELDVLVRAALGLVIARTGFWLLWFFGSGLGFGDVRLAALVGMVTARVGWEPFVVGIYGALLLALGYSIVRSVVTRRSLRGVGIPLGPFVVIGAAAGLLVGAGG
ncbi:leader peptidase (prepilin peptidase)/N-methyltransferase [Nocardioides aromaticivorans]|uniref:Leader peptidase (Prepilin peptidase)/N-methyltransferase n=1 Tax=Nocardioides aromaticivorans TaxID=200618 RepID=A0A7Y9ZNZ9_9ACTN|nr:prepilin peptidase [Nocardioides aromaticivorans]NYI47843.1 leader peptidase (prepilin peptidase)/N-methyltransferase [Nocardioides aromaticivorans]